MATECGLSFVSPDRYTSLFNLCGGFPSSKGQSGKVISHLTNFSVFKTAIIMYALVRRYIEMNEQLVASRPKEVRKRLSNLGGSDV